MLIKSRANFQPLCHASSLAAVTGLLFTKSSKHWQGSECLTFGYTIQGRRQAVRQQVLILPCVGSNPAAPAITSLRLRKLNTHSSRNILQGRRQAVRQQVLILPCVGSNPAAPAIYSRAVRKAWLFEQLFNSSDPPSGRYCACPR